MLKLILSYIFFCNKLNRIDYEFYSNLKSNLWVKVESRTRIVRFSLNLELIFWVLTELRTSILIFSRKYSYFFMLYYFVVKLN